MSNRTWISEHGQGYDVPEAVLKLFRDCSWHNEMCPRFAVNELDENQLTLWVDHPVAEERVVEGGRYLVCRASMDSDAPDLTVYEGDSMLEAITTALKIARDEFKALLSTEQLFFLEHAHLKPSAREIWANMTENERLLMGALRKLRLEATHYAETGVGKEHLMTALKESMDILMQVSKSQGPEALLGDRIDKSPVGTNEYKHVWVGFDEPVCKAYVGSKRWNGWAMPLVDEENLKTFLAHQEKLAEDGTYDVTRGTFNDGVLTMKDDCAAYVVERQTIVHNGKDIRVWDISLGLVWDEFEEDTDYKGYVIKDKQDFGSGPGFLIDGQYVKTGLVVCKDGANIMPGVTWFRTVHEAKTAIDILIEHGPNGFWDAYSGTHKNRMS